MDNENEKFEKATRKFLAACDAEIKILSGVFQVEAGADYSRDANKHVDTDGSAQDRLKLKSGM